MMDEIIDKPAFMAILYTALNSLRNEKDRERMIALVKRFEGSDKILILRNTRRD